MSRNDEIQSVFTQRVDGVPAYTAVSFVAAKHTTALVIPILDEGERVVTQLKEIQRVRPNVDVIIADGGSIDGSTAPDLLAQLGVTTLLTKIGHGQLSAQLRMAFRHCLDSGYEFIITMDGNGKDGVEGVEKIRQALISGFDFVQGSRFLEGGKHENTPLSRFLAVRLLHAPLTSIGANRWYTDTTNGFRGHSSRLLADARVHTFRDCFDSYELLAYLPIRAARLGFRTTEVPVSRVYPRGKLRATKIHGLFAHLHLLRILWRAITGRFSP